MEASEIPDPKTAGRQANTLMRSVLRYTFLGLALVILLACTPLALIQRRVPIPKLFPALAKYVPTREHWLFEPLFLPYGPDLTYVSGNIRTLSHDYDSLWIGGDAGLLAQSLDGAQTWQCFSLNNDQGSKSSCTSPAQQLQPTVVSIRFLSDDRTGFLWTNDGKVYRLSNTRDTWFLTDQSSSLAKQALGLPQDSSGVACANLAANTAVGNNSLRNPNATCVFRPSPRMGWYLTSDNPQLIWQFDPQHPRGRPITARSPRYVTSVCLPAPWYLFIALPLSAVLLYLAWRFRDVVLPAQEDSIANLGISDRPLEWDDEDALGFHAMARGISLFLRNANTGLPLVLAVDGRWGSGKSSLMNLLAANMRDSARTVWFNAWHHQSEEQLLAALLQAVRVQSLENVWSLPGMARRFRLLVGRLRTVWPAVTILTSVGIALLLVAIHFIQDFGKYPVSAASQIPAVFNRWAGLISSVAGLVAVLKKLKQTIGSLIADPASLLASYSGSVTISDLNAQTTFRQRFSNDFKKLTDVLGERRLVIIIDDLDRCRPEKVREIMEAINFLVTSGPCAIILGLARPYVEHFLGYSFKDVVEKMPESLLKPNRNVVYRDAEDVHDAPNWQKLIPTLADDDKPRLYANLYLEKLIQIEVPIPDLTEEQAEALFNRKLIRQAAREMKSNESEEEKDKKVMRQQRLEASLRSLFRGVDRWALPVLGTLLLTIVCGFLIHGLKEPVYAYIDTALSRSQPDSHEETSTTIGGIDIQVKDKSILLSDSRSVPPASTTFPKTPPNSPEGHPETPRPGAKQLPKATSPQVTQSQVPAVASGSLPPSAYVRNGYELPSFLVTIFFTFLVLLFAALLLHIALMRAESLVVNDSSSFQQALKRWIPLAYMIYRNPRSLKRYVNRFLAMRQRGVSETDPASLADRWAKTIAMRLYRIPTGLADASFSDSYGAGTPQGISIPDETLIVLVALEAAPEMWSLVVQSNQLPGIEKLDEVYRSRLSEEGGILYSELRQIWPDVLKYRDRYITVAGHISVT